MGGSEDALLSLYPALVDCFTIILLGYVAGRARWITPSQAQGLNTFTGLFALPALLFSSLATIDWSMVDWMFLLAILISKAVLFFVVLLISLVLQRPSNMGAAGLYAVFTTQSNDFALGYPIVCAIYAQSEPEFVQYIYLLAPISLIILNPIAFILLEVQKASAQSHSQSKAIILLKVIKQIFTNPIIISSLLGFVTNFISNGNLPQITELLLDTLAQAFSAPALFMLGLSAVGKFSNSRPSLSLGGSSLLICAKLLVFPMIAMGVTVGLQCGSETNSTADYSMFAFLYGTIPTAPSVFIYATHYGVAVDMIAMSSVIATVVSAPLMFITATIVGIQMFALEQSILAGTTMDVSIISLVFSAGLLLLFALTRRGCQIPHLMIVILVLFQVLMCVGVLTKCAVTQKSCSEDPLWWEYIVYIYHTLGSIGISTMTCVISLTLYIISCYSFSTALKYKRWLLLYGLGCPVLVTVVVMLSSKVPHLSCSDRTMFTYNQLAIAFCVVALHIIVTVCLLILRHKRMSHRPATDTAGIVDSDSMSNGTTTSPVSSYKSYGAFDGDIAVEERKPLLVDIENLPVASTSSQSADSEETTLISANCAACSVEGCGEQRSESQRDISSLKLGRVLALLIVLIICQVVVLFYYIWLLVDSIELNSHQLAEVEFIYIVAQAGQGFFTFLIFGLDSEIVLAPITKLFRKMVAKIRGSERQEEPGLSAEALHVCRQFVEHHLQHCMDSLQRIPGSKKECFHGAAFSTWLIDAGLTPDSSDAQIYAGYLLLGRIIQPCSKRNLNSFVDNKRTLYVFGKPADFNMFCLHDAENDGV